ncbi:transcription factor bHLH144-like [Neltuma alba]|uniref:transcription factor bHLH144-like n=1 Tax=Neltuma alba TaxID=207710 RepID=UPI0010A47F36|nr:transcription factor bHLH144-like [Prosopis alba]XP_028791054.1 transcription factor bHLH144-like [Prosopis alba]
MANKCTGPALNGHATYNRDSDKNKATPVEGELSSFEEDSKDIDALLSLEGKELEDHDEEEVSTARANENYESVYDTCSSYGSKSKKRSSSSVRKSSRIHGHCSNPEIKHWGMRRMIRVLGGIVPGGGDQMDSVTVLAEAVRYLKSLTVES